MRATDSVKEKHSAKAKAPAFDFSNAVPLFSEFDTDAFAQTVGELVTVATFAVAYCFLGPVVFA